MVYLLLFNPSGMINLISLGSDGLVLFSVFLPFRFLCTATGHFRLQLRLREYNRLFKRSDLEGTDK